MAIDEAYERLFVVLLFLGATVAFAIAFLTGLSSGFDLGALGLTLLSGAFLFERATGRPS
jgi:hypothetical protein